MVCLPVFLLADRVNIDVKGTRQFTAVEIEREMYCFPPVNNAPLCQWLELLREGRHQKQPPTHPVLFNPLHDHESVWWIACWALLHYIPADDIPLDDERLHEQVDYARRLFHPTVFAPERIEVLRYGLPREVAENIPKRFSLLSGIVSAIGNSFVQRYMRAEENPAQIEEQAFEGFWRDLSQAYKMLVEHFKGVKVKILDFKVKRKLDEASNDDWDEGDESPSECRRHRATGKVKKI